MVWVPVSGVGVKALFQSMPILLIAKQIAKHVLMNYCPGASGNNF